MSNREFYHSPSLSLPLFISVHLSTKVSSTLKGSLFFSTISQPPQQSKYFLKPPRQVCG